MRINTVLGLAMTVSLIIPSITHADEKIYELAYTTNMMSTHPVMANGQLPLWRKIQELSGDRIRVTYFEPGTLVHDSELYNATIKGITGTTSLGLSKFKRSFPISSVMDFPVGFFSSSAASLSFLKVYEKYPVIQKEFSKIKLVGVATSVPTSILCVKPIRTIGELKGKRIGVQNSGAAAAIKALGAIPIQLTLSDLYTSLQRGMLDGSLQPIPTFKSTKVTEVAKYMLDCNLTVSSSFSIMSLRFYDSLPDDLKKLIDETVSLHNMAAFSPSWVDGSARSDLEYVIKNNGVEVIKLSKEETAKMRALVEPLFDEWKAEVKKAGGDPDAILTDLRKWNDYYSDHQNVLKERAAFYEIAKDWGCLPSGFME